jgi:Glycosyl transferase family 64 domain
MQRFRERVTSPSRSKSNHSMIQTPPRSGLRGGSKHRSMTELNTTCSSSNSATQQEGIPLLLLSDEDSSDIHPQQWRRSKPPVTSPNILQGSKGHSLSLKQWNLKLIRDARVRWYLLSPTKRRCAMILLPFLLFHILVVATDSLFSRYGGNHGLTHTTSSQHINNNDFAVVINTYKRPHQLADAVRHYADTCGLQAGIQQVYIVWAEEHVTPPEPKSFFHYNAQRRYQNNRSGVTILKVQNSLNSRFLPIPGVEDMAVFMVDDDIRVNCKSLNAGFAAWKVNPNSMVGYYPRLAQISRSETAEFVYQSWPIVFWRNRMNFILTKACFLHCRYMALYSDTENHPREILDYVDKYFNCEDVAMSLLVANITKSESKFPARPIYVEGKVSDMGLFNGISTGTGHMARRSECLTDLTAIYKRHGWDVPLNSVFALRESSWLRHVPGFWWQSRPSNVFEWFALANVFK